MGGFLIVRIGPALGRGPAQIAAQLARRQAQASGAYKKERERERRVTGDNVTTSFANLLVLYTVTYVYYVIIYITLYIYCHTLSDSI